MGYAINPKKPTMGNKPNASKQKPNASKQKFRANGSERKPPQRLTGPLEQMKNSRISKVKPQNAAAAKRVGQKISKYKRMMP